MSSASNVPPAAATKDAPLVVTGQGDFKKIYREVDFSKALAPALVEVADSERALKCARAAYSQELSFLPDTLRNFIEESFAALAPAYYWHVPASLSGKHHPFASRSLGGLVKHTCLAVWWARRFAESLHPSERQLEQEAVAALLLHDLHKHQNPGAFAPLNAKPVEAHGIWTAQALQGYWEVASCPIDNGQLLRITTAIERHMGCWSYEGPEYIYDIIESDDGVMGKLARLVQLADLAAAAHVDDVMQTLRAWKPAYPNPCSR
jgi:hypothetical protein